jgi:hypothetical protein
MLASSAPSLPEGSGTFSVAKMMEEYIRICRQTITTYVATPPILAKCRRGERLRGAVPHQWWWELPLDLDVPNVP